MNFEFSAEQELLRESIRRYLVDKASITGHVRPMLDDDRGCDEIVWKGLADLGVLDLLRPERILGAEADTVATGGEAGMITAGVALEELGRCLTPEPFIASAIAGTTALSGSDAADELLDDVVDGSRISTVAIHEPGRRYEWKDPETIARGDLAGGWTLTGSKCSVLSANAADAFIISARAGADLGLFVVDRADLADAVEPEQSVDRTRKTGRIRLVDTPGRRLVVDDATGLVQRVVDLVSVALAVDGVGAAGAVLEMTVAYATERQQFGVPIGSFQAVQHLCADMLRDLEIARAGAYYALWACQSADAVERHRAALMAKAYASEVLPVIGETAIQVFGGVGFTWEHDVHLFYKRMLSAATLFGNAGQQYDELAGLVIP